ncbi:unnamed protein product [Heligmosomoides polygyrus]|uniref:Uncharacterized protein n=1 Tax=Heligmosomoides polygyrus TaxID=6339 RepID=A0A3P7YC00_HELPZ|nr:unnamed protein product [Heligmosomoides polygyrus]
MTSHPIFGYLAQFQILRSSNYDKLNPYLFSRRHFDDDYSDYHRDFKSQTRDYDRRVKIYQQAIYFVRVTAYIQIFIAGVLLVSDVSRIVLLWTFVQSTSTIIEMLSFPLFSLILGFLSLTCAVSPSSAISKSVLVLLVATVVPNFVFPKQAAFITTAVDAVEVMSLDMSMGMIRSTAHNKLLRILSSTSNRWPLGIQDISSLPPDFLVLLQYLLVSYAMFALLQLVVQVAVIYSLVKLITVQ